MTRRLRKGHALILLTTVWEDGDDLVPSGITLGDGQGQPNEVAWSDLKGSRFYDAIEAQWPALKAQAEAEAAKTVAAEPPAPSRRQRRAATKKKAGT